MAQTERIYWMDAQIRAGRYPNARDVAARFGKSERTAYADRAYLENRLGAPVKRDPARGGWYYEDPTYVLPFLALAEGEASALRRSLLAAGEYHGLADAAALRAVAGRLSPFVAEAGPAAGRESVGGAIHLARDVGVSEDLLRDCERAVAARHRLRLLYYSAHRDSTDERVVRPYGLHNWRGEWYLLAWCEWRQEFRQFLLARAREWSVLEPEWAYVRDPSVDVADYFRRGLAARHGEEAVTVRVRFSPYQARWVRERVYHPSQELSEGPDGGVTLTLRVAGTYEVKRWVLSFGAEAEALEPPSLRAELAEEIKKLGRIYGL